MREGDDLKKELAYAVEMLHEFVEFAHDCERLGVIDGAHDPDHLVRCAERFIASHGKLQATERWCV